ncbi:MAG: hypothetical protein SVR08_14485 [Spirochaetota bacterium]|nr:hypothetical protein [Spirochaetota bacterium]
MNGITIDININTSIEISQLKLDKVINEVQKALSEIGQNLFQALIAELNKAVVEWMRSKRIEVSCKKCGNKN